MRSQIVPFRTGYQRFFQLMQMGNMRGGKPIGPFVCGNCQTKLSSSSTRRWFSQTLRRAAKPAKEDKKYPSRLLIYDSGDARTTWVSFWKAVAFLQFGSTLVFGVPPLWTNQNQPDPNVRKLQAILVSVLGTIPILTLAYLTAPFVHKVFLQIPEQARRSQPDLIRFAQSLNTNQAGTVNTKVEFVTLRIFPFRKHTAVFLHELRALPQRRFRLANIERVKSDQWAKEQRQKGVMKRMLGVLNEPRFKFYVKDGKTFTMMTKVPGVWEEVSRRIREQTLAELRPKESNEQNKMTPKKSLAEMLPKKSVTSRGAGERLRRQTLRR